MVTLYQVAAAQSGLVVGTGNKVEDFGVGFYTKYGDGGVDISPIADLMKSEVVSMATTLGVDEKFYTLLLLMDYGTMIEQTRHNLACHIMI